MRRAASTPRLTRPLAAPEALPLFQGPPVTTTARARRGDPSTSHRAAKKLGDLTERQLAVLRLFEFQALGVTLTDPDFAYWYSAGGKLPQSDSGLRTRRAELVAMGLVEACGTTGGTAGNRWTLWAITEKGRAVVQATR